MEWISRENLSGIETVDDFADLLSVMDTPELTEFQYIIEKDTWIVSIK